eukprot:scaffold117756_cov32-Prasinocladus_malaysianus.AAC.2
MVWSPARIRNYLAFWCFALSLVAEEQRLRRPTARSQTSSRSNASSFVAGRLTVPLRQAGQRCA